MEYEDSPSAPATSRMNGASTRPVPAKRSIKLSPNGQPHPSSSGLAGSVQPGTELSLDPQRSSASNSLESVGDERSPRLHTPIYRTLDQTGSASYPSPATRVPIPFPAAHAPIPSSTFSRPSNGPAAPAPPTTSSTFPFTNYFPHGPAARPIPSSYIHPVFHSPPVTTSGYPYAFSAPFSTHPSMIPQPATYGLAISATSTAPTRP